MPCSLLLMNLTERQRFFDKYSQAVIDKLLYIQCNINKKVSIPNLAYKSSDARDMFCNNLPVILIYGSNTRRQIQSFVTIRGQIDWDDLCEKMIDKEIQVKLSSVLKPALQLATSSQDRHIKFF